MSDPDLSVVIAVRDGAEWVGDAVGSARSADGLLEIVVVDDGSRDDSASVAREAGGPVRVVSTSGRGLPAAHNAGVAASRGELVAFLDSDDRWLAPTPDPRRPLLAGADAVHARVQCRDADGQPRGEPFHLGGLAGLLLRRGALDAVGPFDEGLRRGHDVDWLLRAREEGLGIARSDAVVLEYRLRGESMSGPPGMRSAGLLAAARRSAKRAETESAP